jgi:hypothetical protein
MYGRAVEVVLFDKVMAVYKHSGDIFLYIIGAPEENELILSSVLSCLEESLQTLFNSDAVESAQLDKRTLIENLDMLLLTVDEIIDEGCVPVIFFSGFLSHVPDFSRIRSSVLSPCVAFQHHSRD